MGKLFTVFAKCRQKRSPLRASTDLFRSVDQKDISGHMTVISQENCLL